MTTTPDAAKPATGEAESAPPVLRTATVERSAAVAFGIFTDQIGAWWPLPTHGVFGEKSGGVHFVDEHLVEVAIDGSTTTWAKVLEWIPAERLVLAWHPGGEFADASRVEITFSAEGPERTRVEIRHFGWEAFGEAGLARRRSYVGPSAWGYVLDEYADGVEPRTDPSDLAVLESAYATLFDEFERGGFGEAPDGQWNAQEVMAHVALNDLAMTRVCLGLIHRREFVFENHTCQVPENLSGVILACGDAEGLAAFGRQCAENLVAAIARLDDEQKASMVHCRMEHDGDLVLDETRPWGAIAVDVQAGMHLPAHVEQLQNLRAT